MSKTKTGWTSFHHIISFILVTFASTALSSEKSIKLSVNDWGELNSSKEILAIRPLASIMQKLTLKPDKKLYVLYPGDDNGSKWAYDLRGWLISLGLKSDRIVMSSDSYQENIIEIKIQN